MPLVGRVARQCQQDGQHIPPGPVFISPFTLPLCIYPSSLHRSQDFHLSPCFIKQDDFVSASYSRRLVDSRHWSKRLHHLAHNSRIPQTWIQSPRYRPRHLSFSVADRRTLPSYTASGSFELIAVPDMAAGNAFNDTIKDVSAVVQVAFVLCAISTQITPFLKCIRNSQPSASVRERPFSQAIRTDIFYGCSCYAGRESE
jgi:hypothetical protein